MPGAKNPICILVVAGQFLAKSGFIFKSSLDYSADRGVFNKDVWSFQDQSAHVVLVFARVDEGNGGAIAVAQQDWSANAKLAEEFRQHHLAFMVDIADVPLFF